MPPFNPTAFLDAFFPGGQQLAGVQQQPQGQVQPQVQHVATPQVVQPQVQQQQAQYHPDMVALIRALGSIMNPDPLGATARGNTRPGGLTPATDWAAMFAPTSAARQAQMTNHPQAPLSAIANAEGYANRPSEAVAASPLQPRGGPTYWPQHPLPGTVEAAKINHQALFPTIGPGGSPMPGTGTMPTHSPIAHLLSAFGF